MKVITRYTENRRDMKFKYISNYTGELYRNLWHAITAIAFDMRHYPKCRTIKMFSISKYKEG